MTRRIRTNAPEVILNSGFTLAHEENAILAYYRDTHDGQDSVLELLWTTQLLRMDYDSPRIGGGIDPSIATLGASSTQSEREEEGTFTNYLLGSEAEPSGVFDDQTTEYIQDCIVHAEAVALLWLEIYGNDT